jgi:hypothetical protein
MTPDMSSLEGSSGLGTGPSVQNNTSAAAKQDAVAQNLHAPSDCTQSMNRDISSPAGKGQMCRVVLGPRDDGDVNLDSSRAAEAIRDDHPR